MGKRSDVQCRYRYQQIPKSQPHQIQKESSPELAFSPKEKSNFKHSTNRHKTAIRSNSTPQTKLEAQSASPMSATQKGQPTDAPLTTCSTSFTDQESTSYDHNENILLVVPEEIKFDDRIPLASASFDLFKSDQLFDSSFWLH